MSRANSKAENRKICGSRTCKPNSVCREAPLAGTTYRRTAIPLGCSLLSSSSDLPGGLARRASTRPAEAELPPYLVLLRVGFALPAALLRQRCALTAPFHPYLARPKTHQAVCFLWHFPSSGFETGFPDVIRHTALWSSDFPLVLRRATVRSSCLPSHYIR
jgi:hypothetical protein